MNDLTNRQLASDIRALLTRHERTSEQTCDPKEGTVATIALCERHFAADFFGSPDHPDHPELP